MKLAFSLQIFKKYPNVKFHENPSSWSRVVTCGRTDRRIYVTKLTVIQIEFSLQIFEKYPNVKFHENPSSWSRVVTCGRTGRRIDVTKLTVIQIEYSLQIFEKYPNVKFHENPPSWSRVVPCGRTYVTKLTVMQLEIFSTDFRKIIKCQISRKSDPLEPSCSMRTGRQTDRRTDVTDLTVAFHNFTEHLEKSAFWNATLYILVHTFQHFLYRPNAVRIRYVPNAKI